MMPRCRRPDVIPNPVDTNVFTPAVTNDQIRRYSILTVGRHDADSEHKGYDVLINAMSLLRNRRPDLPISLTITGTGELIERHKATIASLGLQNTVFLAGKVTRETLVRLYQTTDVFAFPSRITVAGGTIYGEGFGVVNIEAAACGRPVITSTHGGCPETIVDGLTGFLVDPTSVSAVTGAIETMFAMSHEDRDQMGLRGRALAVQRFSSQQFQRNIAKIISPALPK
jgi:phosphatidylinositol alpha-1,6-mannosyltransferase